MKYRVLLTQDEDGIYVAEVPNLPGCVSDGKTREQAMTNVKEAIEVYLEDVEKHGDAVPAPVSEEVYVEV